MTTAGTGVTAASCISGVAVVRIGYGAGVVGWDVSEGSVCGCWCGELRYG